MDIIKIIQQQLTNEIQKQIDSEIMNYLYQNKYQYIYSKLLSGHKVIFDKMFYGKHTIQIGSREIELDGK